MTGESPLLRAAGLAIVVGLLGACEQPMTVPDDEVAEPASVPLMARKQASANPVSDDLSEEAVARITEMVDGVNERLAAGGNPWRLNYPWLFRVGMGTDPWGQLRTGARWPASPVAYILDELDYTTDLPDSEVDAALAKAYQTWNDVRNTHIQAVRVPDPAPALNLDILDGTFSPGGDCLDVVDVAADNLIFYDPATGAISFVPAAHIYVGGWLGPDYFEKCLGSPFIIGVTWFFSFGDTNSDNYVDQLYVEQFYNEGFTWVTSGAVFLGSDIDLESVAAHENGHSHGLGHFGGPHPRQPLLLRPNGNIFTPEAVMNPGYFGGEKRNLLPPDLAGLRTLYGGPH
jgi:hypothetical protein